MVFEDLNAFVAVARLESFSRAAAQLRVAQSSLSKRVQRLEQHLGTRLLERGSRGVTLTASGVTLLGRAEGLVREFEDMGRNALGDLPTPRGQIRLALPPLTSRFLAPLVCEQCRTQYPDIGLYLRSGASDYIHQWLLNGEVDIALMYNPEVGRDFEVAPLVTEPLYLMAPARDAAGRRASYPDKIAVRDLAKLPLLMFRRPHSLRVIVDRLCAKHGVEPNIVVEIEGIEMCQGMLAKGLGVAIFHYASLAPDIEAGRVRAIPFSTPLMNWKLCMVWPRQSKVSPAIAAVRGVIERELDGLLRMRLWHKARRIKDY